MKYFSKSISLERPLSSSCLMLFVCRLAPEQNSLGRWVQCCATGFLAFCDHVSCGFRILANLHPTLDQHMLDPRVA